MYKLQLGDCFLLTFPKDDGGEFHVLIDCGLIQGAKNPAESMTDVATDIKKRTAGVIDLVLITHEHWDHLSGFSEAQARAIFKDIAFRQLWVAWTEDPSDTLANRLRSERQGRAQAIDRALDRLGKQQGLDDEPQLKIAAGLRAFAGAAAGAGGGRVGEAFDWVKNHAGKANTRFCRPGDLLTLPGVSGVRVYVLGPPHDEDQIRRSSPSRAHPETYLAEAQEQIRIALDEMAEAGSAPPTPFDSVYAIDRGQPTDVPLLRSYLENAEDAWRRVDADWLLGLVGPLALQLDSDTNNTSLAVAFELLPSRKVLLFPGDAQVGNWLSWQDLKEWSGSGPDAAKVPADMDDLFARTVLYKVGHHGSHNATLKEQGLQRMTGDDLRALIPVVPDFAKTVKHWTMPWPDLLKDLQARAPSRVFDATADAGMPDMTVTELYIEVPVPNGGR